MNEFLEVITTDRNKVLSATHQEESPPPAKEWKESTQNFAFVKEVCSTIACQAKEKFVFTKHKSAEKLFNPFLFQENTNDSCLPCTELETIEVDPSLCKERLTTELSV